MGTRTRSSFPDLRSLTLVLFLFLVMCFFYGVVRAVGVLGDEITHDLDMNRTGLGFALGLNIGLAWFLGTYIF